MFFCKLGGSSLNHQIVMTENMEKSKPDVCCKQTKSNRLITDFELDYLRLVLSAFLAFPE